ncbi:hypothetical protein POF43_004200 [Streptomyces sp. SL54]|uniref:DUF2188 domain-containing protein n=1 Tax=Streptantibioticus silvisoli TaxID=2705255 RepID=A0ABT6VTX6_9ACTN|nr:hypothetical protein [Streptantibioticus silvisoli]
MTVRSVQWLPAHARRRAPGAASRAASGEQRYSFAAADSSAAIARSSRRVRAAVRHGHQAEVAASGPYVAQRR